MRTNVKTYDNIARRHLSALHLDKRDLQLPLGKKNDRVTLRIKKTEVVQTTRFSITASKSSGRVGMMKPIVRTTLIALIGVTSTFACAAAHAHGPDWKGAPMHQPKHHVDLHRGHDFGVNLGLIFNFTDGTFFAGEMKGHRPPPPPKPGWHRPGARIGGPGMPPPPPMWR